MQHKLTLCESQKYFFSFVYSFENTVHYMIMSLFGFSLKKMSSSHQDCFSMVLETYSFWKYTERKRTLEAAPISVV